MAYEGADGAAGMPTPPEAPRRPPSADLPARRPVVAPGTLTSLRAPTTRPGEPVTAGLPIGAGPGPEVLGAGLQPDEALYHLRAVYRSYPREEIRRLIERAEREK